MTWFVDTSCIIIRINIIKPTMHYHVWNDIIASCWRIENHMRHDHLALRQFIGCRGNKMCTISTYYINRVDIILWCGVHSKTFTKISSIHENLQNTRASCIQGLKNKILPSLLSQKIQRVSRRDLHNATSPVLRKIIKLCSFYMAP